MGANTSATLKNARGQGGTALMALVALQTTSATTSAGTEPTGGSPAYARKATSWATWANGTSSTAQTHDVPSGTNVQSLGLLTSAGAFLDSVAVTPQTFSSQGTYADTISDTQS